MILRGPGDMKHHGSSRQETVPQCELVRLTGLLLRPFWYKVVGGTQEYQDGVPVLVVRPSDTGTS